jgi:hypothetical protein
MSKLYQELHKLPLPTGSLETLWNKYASLIASLPHEHMVNLYLIILHCATLEGVANIKGKKLLPYKGKNFESGRGALYVIADIPIDTQMLLLKYLIYIHEDI